MENELGGVGAQSTCCFVAHKVPGSFFAFLKKNGRQYSRFDHISRLAEKSKPFRDLSKVGAG
jgi:hypothetical protein